MTEPDMVDPTPEEPQPPVSGAWAYVRYYGKALAAGTVAALAAYQGAAPHVDAAEWATIASAFIVGTGITGWITNGPKPGV